MSGKFVITSANTHLPLNGKSQGEASFTVSNSSPRPMRAQARVVPLETARQEWFAIVGETERSFRAGATQQFTVLINVPPGTEASKHSFRLDVISDDNPDENFGEGPTVAFEVKPSQAPAKPFPWWAIAAIVAAVLLVGGGASWLLWPEEKVAAHQEEEQPPRPIMARVPPVTGLATGSAEKVVRSAGLVPKLEREKELTACGVVVLSQSPKEGEVIEAGTEVTLVHKTQTDIPDQVQWLNVKISEVSLNGSGENHALVYPGSSLGVRLKYSISDPGCPGCIDQIQVGFSHNDPTSCVYNGVPGPSMREGYGEFSLKVPQEPGTYFIGVDRSQAYSCPNKWWSGNPGPDRYIATICVKPR